MNWDELTFKKILVFSRRDKNFLLVLFLGLFNHGKFLIRIDRIIRILKLSWILRRIRFLIRVDWLILKELILNKDLIVRNITHLITACYWMRKLRINMWILLFDRMIREVSMIGIVINWMRLAWMIAWCNWFFCLGIHLCFSILLVGILLIYFLILFDIFLR